MDLTWRDFYRSPYLLFLPFMLVVGLYVELAPFWDPSRGFLHSSTILNPQSSILFDTACLGGNGRLFLPHAHSQARISPGLEYRRSL